MADNASPVDSISIEIGASSDSAVAKIQKVVDVMKEMKTASSFKSESFKKLSECLSALAGAMKAVDSEGISKLRQVASAIKTFENVKDVKINNKFAENVANIAAALDLMKQDHIDRLNKFGQALENLKSVKMSGYDKLPAALLNIAGAVDQITDDSIMRIHRLTLALGRLRGVDLSGLGSVMRETRAARTEETRAAQRASQEEAEQQSASGQIPRFDNSSDLLTNLRQIGRELAGNVNPAMSALLSTVSRIAKGILKWSFKTVLSTVRKITSSIAKIGKSLINFGKAKIKDWWDKSAFIGLEKSLSRINNIIHSFGRIAFYRAIRSAIKYVTDALKEGTENAYWFSQEFGTVTHYIAEAYDRLASSNFKMSNQLGAAWSTMIATVEPILIQLLNLVTRVADAITRFFAILSGKTTYMRAIDYTKAWADEADKGSKAAKEWKNQLLGFDEINRLEAPSDSGSGSGKKDYTDYGNMFEEAPVGEWFEEIKRAFENGKWSELGKLLGDKFNEIVDSFDWGAWGRKIGGYISAAVETSYSFLKTADFRNLGNRIAEFLNNAGESINFETLGRLAMRIKTALWDLLVGAIEGIDWKGLATRLSDYFLGSLNELAEWLRNFDPSVIANAIHDFISGIKGEEIKSAFLTVVKLAWQRAVELKNLIFDDATREQITNGLMNFFTEIPWLDIGQRIHEKLKEAWQFVQGKFEEWFPPEKREELKQKIFSFIAEAINSVDWAALHNVLQYSIDKAFLPDWWVNWYWTKGDYAGKETVMGMITGVQETTQAAEASMQTAGETMTKGLTTAITNGKASVETALSNTVDKPADNAVIRFLKKIGLIKTAYAADMTEIEQLSGNMSLNVSGEYDKASGTPMEKFGTNAENAKNRFAGASSEISNKASEMSSKTGQSFNEMGNKVKTATDQMHKQTQTGFNDMQKSVNSTINNLKTTLSNNWSQIKADTTSKVTQMRSQIVSEFRTIYSELSATVSQIKQLLNFQWSIPRPKIPQIGWYYNYVQSGDGSVFAIPQFYVNWYAKGGIFDEATMIGVGENGKEAVVPLENNTEWIDMIASKLQKSGGMDGSDTSDAVEEGSLEIVTALYAVSTQIISAMKENGSRGSNMDFDGFVRRVTSTQRKQARADGLA